MSLPTIKSASNSDYRYLDFGLRFGQDPTSPFYVNRSDIRTAEVLSSGIVPSSNTVLPTFEDSRTVFVNCVDTGAIDDLFGVFSDANQVINSVGEIHHGFAKSCQILGKWICSTVLNSKRVASGRESSSSAVMSRLYGDVALVDASEKQQLVAEFYVTPAYKWSKARFVAKKAAKKYNEEAYANR